MTLAVRAVGGGGGGATVGGGAAGGVGDVHPLTEQLGHQLDIGGLAAAGAGAGELEVGLGELGGLHVLVADGVGLDGDRVHAVGPVVRLVQLALQRPHGQGRLLGQTHVDAAAAAGAVIGRDLEAVGIFAAHALGVHGAEAHRLAGLFGAVQKDGTDGRMRAHQGALVTLQALGGVPLRNLHCGATLFILGRTCGPGAVLHAVLHHGGHGDAVALLAVHHSHYILDEGGGAALPRRVLGVQPTVGDRDFLELVDAVVDGGVIHVHHCLALLLVVGLVDGLLHLGDRLVDGDDPGEGEEGGLQDGVGPAAQTQLPGDADGVDGIEPGVLGRQGPLHGRRQVLLQARLVPGAVEQEGAALFEVFHHVVLMDIRGSVAGHEVRRGDQIGGADGHLAEAQVALGQAAGLLGVIDEVGLAVEAGGVADDLNGVLVGTHGAVGAHAPELGAGLAGGRGFDLLGRRQGGVGHVVQDANGEVVLGRLRL